MAKMKEQELTLTGATPDELWLRYWEENLARQRAVQGQEDTSTWRAGGRATIANPNKEDGDWWKANGLSMVNNWVNFRNAEHNLALWVTPQGVPAIELVFNINLDDVMVKGALDRMMVLPDGSLVVLDIKSGARMPSSDFQLGIYAVAMEEVFGVRPKYGVYWDARKGTTSELINLDKWTRETVSEIVGMFDKARRAGIFIPNFDHCKMCNFTNDCKYQNGDK
jgi:putative RecB family exonuclease